MLQCSTQGPFGGRHRNDHSFEGSREHGGGGAHLRHARELHRSLGPSDEPVTPSDEPVTQPGPNLVVSSPSVSNSAPAVGATFTVSATVRNDGNEVSGATTMRFYLSTDATITTSDTEVGTAGVTGLDTAGSSRAARSGSHSARLFATSEPSTYYYHGEVEVTAPSTAGTYYYGACVDAVTDESETTNNCSSSVRVTVGRRTHRYRAHRTWRPT